VDLTLVLIEDELDFKEYKLCDIAGNNIVS